MIRNEILVKALELEHDEDCGVWRNKKKEWICTYDRLSYYFQSLEGQQAVKDKVLNILGKLGWAFDYHWWMEGNKEVHSIYYGEKEDLVVDVGSRLNKKKIEDGFRVNDAKQMWEEVLLQLSF